MHTSVSHPYPIVGYSEGHESGCRFVDVSVSLGMSMGTGMVL